MFLALVAIFGGMIVHLLTDYIWMNSLGFSSVFTTILWSKVILASVGFLLFAGAMFMTLFWIWHTYIKEMDMAKFGSIFQSGKIMSITIITFFNYFWLIWQ